MLDFIEFDVCFHTPNLLVGLTKYTSMIINQNNLVFIHTGVMAGLTPQCTISFLT